MKHIRPITSLLAATTLGLFAPAAAFADGSEELGPPSVVIAEGTQVIVAGTGMSAQPATINIDIPVGATVEQVLLYWEGEGNFAGDDQIVVDGIPVDGALIGGPTLFYNFNGPVYSSCFRADITGLGLIGPGSNAVKVSGLDYGLFENGAGMLVIIDDGSGKTKDLDVRDGLDLAFASFSSPLDATVPQTYTFNASASDVTATLSLLFATVGEDRPNRIRVTIDGVATDYDNFLGSNDGPDWDSLTLDVLIPAGEDTVTVEAISLVDGTGLTPASLSWIASALCVPVIEEDEIFEGCTPGFWKNRGKRAGYWDDTDFDCKDLYSDVFGIGPDITLLKALSARGNKNGQALLRHSVAALLNASHPDINYAYSEDEVLDWTFDAWADGSKDVINSLKDDFDFANNAGCEDL